MNASEYPQFIQEAKRIVSEAILHKGETVIMPDGFGADTVKLHTTPLETDGHLVKLACATPGKEYMIRWARKSDLEKALKERS